MALVLNGSTNAIGGLAVGGVPDGTIDADALAANAVTTAKILNSNVTSGKLASGVGGKVLQVVNDSEYTQTSCASQDKDNAVDTGLACTITPSSASNKILIEWTGVIRGNGSNDWATLLIKRNDVLLDLGSTASWDGYCCYATAVHGSLGGWAHMDSPNTTSATTYKICILGYQGTGYHIGTNTWDVNSLTVSEIAA